VDAGIAVDRGENRLKIDVEGEIAADKRLVGTGKEDFLSVLPDPDCMPPGDAVPGAALLFPPERLPASERGVEVEGSARAERDCLFH